MTSRILTLFTRAPLHVGAGASVGAIDQPIIRERHTGFPTVPGSSLKGALADLWHSEADASGVRRLDADVTWLFGSNQDSAASAGALSFGEARLLAFPIRSARGSYAWLTSPLLLARAARDGVRGVTSLSTDVLSKLEGRNGDLIACFCAGGPLALPVPDGAQKPRIVLEDYALEHLTEPPADLAGPLGGLLPSPNHFSATIAERLVIVSDGMLSHFARTACEVAQHVRINDATGTAEDGALFNQENVPADTLFYAVIHATRPRSSAHRAVQKTEADALQAVAARLAADDVRNTVQLGGDASTGLGFCSAHLV